MKLKFNAKEHAYWLDGRRCKGATTVAKIPDDPYKLNQWRLHMAAIGTATKPGLAESIAAHHDQRDKVEDFVGLAIEYAKANDASRRGSDAHRIAERIDLGEELIDTPLARQVRQAWTEALEEAGLEIVPQYIERIVVHPDLYIAGTFDRLVRHWQSGRLFVLDLKTGPNAIVYPHAVAIQLAIYANAPLIAASLPASGGTTTQFEPMPDDVDRDWAYIVHMPSDTQVTVPRVKISAGWQDGMEIVKRALKWRARSDLIEQQISAATWTPRPRLVAEDGAVEPQDPPPTAPVPSTISTARLHWIQARCRKIVDDGHGRTLMLHWPAPVPLFRDGGPRTNQEIDLISTACDTAETDHQIPFGDTDPDQPTTTKATRSKQHEPVS